MARKVHTPRKAKTLAVRGGSPLTKTPLNKMKGSTRKAADQVANVVKDAVALKAKLDARTLFIRFSEKLPKTVDEIKELHSGIQLVRTPRTAGTSNCRISFAFLEFGTAEECIAAKEELANTKFKEKSVYVDCVGENSNAKKKTKGKEQAQLNPTRLFISNLGQGVDKTKLKEKFPKAVSVCIPQNSKKKGTTYGFVQFSSPAEAKAAFDASQDIAINEQKITVLFAKMMEEKQELQNTKGEKRKAEAETEEVGMKRVKGEVTKEEETTEADSLTKVGKRETGKQEGKSKILKTSNEVEKITNVEKVIVECKVEEGSEVDVSLSENEMSIGVDEEPGKGVKKNDFDEGDEEEDVAEETQDMNEDVGEVHGTSQYSEASEKDEQNAKKDDKEKDTEILGDDKEDFGGDENEFNVRDEEGDSGDQNDGLEDDEDDVQINNTEKKDVRGDGNKEDLKGEDEADEKVVENEEVVKINNEEMNSECDDSVSEEQKGGDKKEDLKDMSEVDNDGEYVDGGDEGEIVQIDEAEKNIGRNDK